MLKLIFLSLASLSASANSLTAIQGKIVSITQNDIALQRYQRTYFIKKSALTPKEVAMVGTVGKTVTLHVPLEAIEAVKTDKN